MYALTSDSTVLLLNPQVSLIPTCRHMTTGLSTCQQSKAATFSLMEVDLPLGTEQALMLHSVSIIPCTFDVAVVVACH